LPEFLQRARRCEDAQNFVCRLCEALLLLQKAPVSQNVTFWPRLNFRLPGNMGIGDKEPSTLKIQEQAKRRSGGNVAGDVSAATLARARAAVHAGVSRLA
jgi:hypothetical protein